MITRIAMAVALVMTASACQKQNATSASNAVVDTTIGAEQPAQVPTDVTATAPEAENQTSNMVADNSASAPDLTEPADPQAAAPPSPYVDKGACPFEGCTYRAWGTTKSVTLLDRPGGQVSVTSIPGKTVVQALTGEVHSRPQKKIASHAYADTPILQGDAFYVLHYSGEGSYAVWFKGHVIEVSLDDGEVNDETLHAEWWARVKTANGKEGWIEVTDQFDNQDALG